jgi:hypothetical protein
MKKDNLWKWISIWFLAVALTAVALVYQSINGPTKPKSETLWLSDEQVYKFRLPRSHGGNTNCLIELAIPDVSINAELLFRRYPTNEEWQKVNLVRVGDKLAGFLPYQPPAGKLEYYFKFTSDKKVVRLPVSEQVVIRFRGDIPAGIIIPHALLMFIAMLLSNVALFLAIFGMKQFRLYSFLTLAALIVGGFIFGPLVQKYAFGVYWTGFPFGMDLTDNKTLISLVFWLLAVGVNLKKERRIWVILASIVMVVIFSIPHSARGSELNPDTGKIETGYTHEEKIN